ncbi:YoaK family protein [Cypionkella sp.]|uniref:YoaK family protein n=1 Tax=Cypionkella sp. TaxID=2811411 RepID=UPI00261A43AC|nr:YoaK family protein [Cypionkella sp.]MDB5664227.1 hypothetical protein [Cypionkella sp.]
MTFAPDPKASKPQRHRVRPTLALRKFRLIASHHRIASSDRALAFILAGIAGAANAGGFILLGSYTSHMTGYLSALADNLVLHNLALVGQSLFAITLFVLGAATSAVVINWGRAHARASQYSLPIGLQGGLLIALAAISATPLPQAIAHPLGLGLLCFIMGLQNATITKISYARIRTTHATGMITDIGIELGRAVYGRAFHSPITADRAKLTLLLQLLTSFLLGGLVGAFGYSLIGFAFSLPLAAILLTMALL